MYKCDVDFQQWIASMKLKTKTGLEFESNRLTGVPIGSFSIFSILI